SRRLSLSTRALAGLSPLSLHDALPILPLDPAPQLVPPCGQVPAGVQEALQGGTGSGVPEVVLGQLGPLLVQRVVLDQVTGDRPGARGRSLRETRHYAQQLGGGVLRLL